MRSLGITAAGELVRTFGGPMAGNLVAAFGPKLTAEIVDALGYSYTGAMPGGAADNAWHQQGVPFAGNYTMSGRWSAEPSGT